MLKKAAGLFGVVTPQYVPCTGVTRRVNVCRYFGADWCSPTQKGKLSYYYADDMTGEACTIEFPTSECCGN